MNANVVCNRDVSLTDLGGGVSRKVLSHDERMMVVEVRFAQGGAGAVHAHPHAQSTYVVSGEFCFAIDGQDVVVRPGDTITFAPNVPHGTLCLQAGTLVDIFTPMREDFL